MENSKVIRVAQIIGKMMGGGVESVVMNYYRHIDKSKIQFDFIIDEDSTVVPREEIESMGGKIYTVPPYQKITEYIPALTKLFKENGYQIVHSHLNTLSVFPLYAAKKAGVPVRIAHNHSTAGKGETKKNILKYTLRPFAKLNATHYAACSEYAGAWLFGRKTVNNGKVTIFNNAIDIDKFKFKPNIRNDARKELGIEDKFVVGHVGRFCYQKNQEFVVDIFKEIKKRVPNSMLLFIGNGKTKNEIKNKVYNLNIENSVLFLDNCNDIYKKYQAMDVFLFPSRYEGLGMVAIEAQAVSLNVVASTEVPIDTNLTEYIHFKELSAGAKSWAESAISITNAKKDMTEVIRKSGYDICLQCKELTKYYLSLLEGTRKKEI